MNILRCTLYAVLLALVLGVGCAISTKETLPGTYALDEGGYCNDLT